MKKNLYINDINIGDFGIYISSDTYLDAPLIDYTEYQIPARNGNVIQYNKRLNNVIRKFDCYIPENQDVQQSLNKLKMLLYKNIGYMKLQSDYDIELYQYGYLAEGIENTPFMTKTTNFTLYFSCMPERYYVDPEETETIDFFGGSYRFYPASSKFVNSLFSKVSNFYNAYNTYVALENIILPVSNETINVSITNTSDEIKFGALCVMDNYATDRYTILKVLGISDDGDFNLSFDNSQFTRGHRLCIVYPLIYSSYDVTANITYGGSTHTDTFNFDESIIAKVTSDDSFVSGVTLKSVFDNMYPQSPNNDDAFWLVNEVIVRYDFESMYADGVCDTILNMCDGIVYTDVFNKRAYAIESGTSKKLSLDNYLYIEGNVAYQNETTVIESFLGRSSAFMLIRTNLIVNRWVL